MPSVDNNEALMSMIYADVYDMLDDVAQQTREKIQDFVKEIVYDAYPEGRYRRRKYVGGFLGSWVNTDPGIVAENILQTEIYNDPNLMVYDPMEYQHGDMFEDRRSVMDEAIAEGKYYNFEDSAASIERDYWSPTLNMLGDNKTVETMIEQNLRRLGVNFIKS
jgi:hypothetical protein